VGVLVQNKDYVTYSCVWWPLGGSNWELLSFHILYGVIVPRYIITLSYKNYLGLLSRRSLQILEGGCPMQMREEGKVAVAGWIFFRCDSSCALQASLRPATCVLGRGAFRSSTAPRFEQGRMHLTFSFQFLPPRNHFTTSISSCQLPKVALSHHVI
jgi:hypothetical protein